MDRREALKSISLSTGMVISSGAFFSLLQSCQPKDSIAWQPLFFTNEEAITVSEIANVILPTTDTPGALDVGVPQFIDLLLKDVFKQEDSSKFRKGLQAFVEKFEKDTGDKFYEADQEQQEAAVKKVYEVSKEETKDILSLVRKAAPPAGNESRYYMYSFLVTLRDLTIKAYFTSEKVGEEILSYDPVPGRQEGCVPVDDVGNVWAL
jgi:hypothetical protein